MQGAAVRGLCEEQLCEEQLCVVRGAQREERLRVHVGHAVGVTVRRVLFLCRVSVSCVLCVYSDQGVQYVLQHAYNNISINMFVNHVLYVGARSAQLLHLYIYVT